MLPVLMGALLAEFSNGLRILSPPHLAGQDLKCPPMTGTTGPQKMESGWSSADEGVDVVTLDEKKMKQLCAGKKLDGLDGRIVLVEDMKWCFNIGSEEWYRLFLASGPPKAIVSLAGVSFRGGYHVNVWESFDEKERREMKSADTLFLSCGQDSAKQWADLLLAAQAAEAGEGGAVSLWVSIDPNRWIPQWTGPWYIFVARTLLPSWGFLVIFYAFNILRHELGKAQPMKLHHYALINESLALGGYSLLMVLGGQFADDVRKLNSNLHANQPSCFLPANA